MDALLRRGREVSEPKKYTMLQHGGDNSEYEQTLDTYHIIIVGQRRLRFTEDIV